MYFESIRQSRRVLARSAAILMVGGLAAGCSSGVARFSDDIFTGSTANQRSIIQADNQPFPGDVAATTQPNNYPAAASSASPAPVTRSSLPPVASASTSTPVASAAPLPAPTQVASAPRIEAAPAAVPQPVAEPKPVGAPKPTQSSASVDSPINQVPSPRSRPETQVAVLPQQPKPKQEPNAGTAGGATPTTSASDEGGVYTVVSGDSLYGIARKTGSKVEAIKAANGLDSGAIRVGQKLRIPTAGQATAEARSAPKVDPVLTGSAGPAKKTDQAKADTKTETLTAYTPPTKAEKPIAAAVASSDAEAPDSTGIGKMRWPVRGRVIGTYGGSNSRDGIDIAVPEGTPVKAAENGVVIYAGDGLKDFGQTVLIRHADGKVTVYGHASEIKVSRGDNVRRGQEIARSGMSGNADTPKLHFEVRKDSEPVDPKQFLE